MILIFYFKEKNSPLWDEIFLKIENSTDKKTIGESLDKTLQNNEDKYKIKIFEKIKGPYSSIENYICETPSESSWNSYLFLVNLLQIKNKNFNNK